MAVVRPSHKQTNTQTHRQGRLQYTAQLSAQRKYDIADLGINININININGLSRRSKKMETSI